MNPNCQQDLEYCVSFGDSINDGSPTWLFQCHSETEKKLIEKTHLRYRLAMRQERKNLEATGGVMDPTTRLELLGTGLRKTMFPGHHFLGAII